MKISIIIPVYNVENNLESLIRSILNQSYDNYELILIDDGSKDRSSEICDEFADKYSHIICLHQKNAGVSSARNRGLSMATGDYITFIDSDDSIKEDYLKCLAKATDNESNDIVIGGYRIIHNGFGLDEDRFINDVVFDTTELDAECMAKALKLGLLNSTWGKLFSKDAIKDIKYNVDMSYGEDTCFLLDSIKKAKRLRFASCSNYTYICDTGLSVANSPKKIDSMIKYLDALYEFESTGLSSNRAWESAVANKIMNEIFGILSYVQKTESRKAVFRVIDKLLVHPRTAQLVKVFVSENSKKLRLLKALSSKLILKIFITLES